MSRLSVSGGSCVRAPEPIGVIRPYKSRAAFFRFRRQWDVPGVMNPVRTGAPSAAPRTRPVSSGPLRLMDAVHYFE